MHCIYSVDETNTLMIFSILLLATYTFMDSTRKKIVFYAYFSYLPSVTVLFCSKPCGMKKLILCLFFSTLLIPAHH
ncbi:hypothetical protein K438DRAFT_1265338 [Mycena galopus ATCC 62051]|nr:hypothetical protein K438DRAFT_1265338 [Mycena galopus ATCC 62051]